MLPLLAHPDALHHVQQYKQSHVGEGANLHAATAEAHRDALHHVQQYKQYHVGQLLSERPRPLHRQRLPRFTMNASVEQTTTVDQYIPKNRFKECIVVQRNGSRNCMQTCDNESPPDDDETAPTP